MANCCDVDMKIMGGKDEVQEMVAMLSRSGPYASAGVGRCFEFSVAEFCESAPGVFEALCHINCDWSIKADFREDGLRARSLESESGRLGLFIEAFSSETDLGFQEHVLIAHGNVLVDDCVKYEEHFVEAFPSLEAFNAANKTSFTRDMVNVNGEVCIGGFGESYGVFLDFESVCKAYDEFVLSSRLDIDARSLNEKIVEAIEEGRGSVGGERSWAADEIRAKNGECR